MNHPAVSLPVSTQRTILILGAAGRLGYAATQAFARAGWRVVAQARRVPAQGWPAGVLHTTTPLQATEQLCAKAGVSTRAVLYAVNPPYTRWAQDLLPWARCGMDVAERLNALFMLPSNVYQFGQGMPPLLTRDTPVAPTARKGMLRASLELELQNRSHPHAVPRLRSTVLRAGDFFGSGQGSWLDLVVAKSLQEGRITYPGKLGVMHPWAYLPDLAEAFVRLAVQDELPWFSQFQFAGHNVTGAEFVAALEAAAASLNLKPVQGYKPATMPWWAIHLGAPVVPLWRELAEMRYLWQVPHALDGRDLQKQIGEMPSTPLVPALTQALVDLGHTKAASQALISTV